MTSVSISRLRGYRMRAATISATLLSLSLSTSALGAGTALDTPSHGADRPTVEIIEFSDYQCPFCSRAQPTLAAIAERYPADVRFRYMHNPLPFHKDAEPAARAAVAAHAAGKFWELHEVLFSNQRALTRTDLEAHAAAVGLHPRRISAEMDTKRVGDIVRRDQRIARAVGARGTPGFFINGKQLKGAQPLETFARLIDAEIEAASAARQRGAKWIAARTRENNADLAKYLYDGVGPPTEAAAAKPSPSALDETVWKVVVQPENPTAGPSDALVTLVEYSDFQCPFCNRLQPTLDQVFEHYKGEVRLVFKHQPLPFHKDAFGAAIASICAHEQGEFWLMHDALFKHQRQLKTPDLVRYAGELGLDTARLSRCMDDPAMRQRVDNDIADALTVGARGTPNVFINGRKLVGARPFEDYRALIDEELTKARALVKAGVPRDRVYEHIIKTAKRKQLLDDKVRTFDLSRTPRRGNEDAKVKIVIFSDFQCPYCKRAEPALARVIEHYGAGVAVYFKNFPLSFHKQAEPAALAAVCAHRQGRFWAMHDKLFDRQRSLKDDLYPKLAGELGLDIGTFRECLTDPDTRRAVRADMTEASGADVRGTPTIFVNGRKFSADQGYNLDAFKRAIDSLSVTP